MKTKCIKIDWLIPFVGVAVVAATVVAATTYLDLERKIQGAAAFNATLERLHQDRQVSLALREIHEGKAKEAAQRLDVVLCQNILRTDAELGLADAWARTFVEDVFREMALFRPSSAQGGAAGAAEARSIEQLAAERILNRALGIAHTARAQ